MHLFSKQALGNLSEPDQILFERYGQGPQAPLPYAYIHHAIEAQALAQPAAMAARHQAEHISYGELNQQAERLAVYLQAAGVQPGDAVGLFLQRSIPMLVGLLAVLKVGAAYVPQHVGVAPVAQLRNIMHTAQIKVVLTLAQFVGQLPPQAGHRYVAIDEFMAQGGGPLPLAAAVPQRLLPGPDARCFILFTSGTTGEPSGVQVSHRNVCNVLLTEPGSLGMRPGRKVGQILNIAFDMAAWEILGCLAHGAELLIRGKDFQQVAEQVDVLIATPSILGRLDAGRCANVKVVAVAGEPCPRPLADKWASFCQFFNSCGPTETTIINTAQHYTTASARLNIGTPTPNNTVYVLDEQRRPLPIGAVGEMWAGGAGVSLGYLNNPALNQARYAPDPFLGGDQRMFRTRDLGCWTADGQLEHHGRVDDQVKILGFRVELDAISTLLEAQPACSQGVTLKLDDRTVISFVCPAVVDVGAARAQLSAVLPYYSVPAFILALDSLPMTSRGKVDKATLLAQAQAYQLSTAQPLVAHS